MIPPDNLYSVGAAADCELITSGLLGQPVNSITTFAFVLAGLIVGRRPQLKWVGIALIATGVGSFLFHGPMPPGSQWAHDVSMAWLILVIAGIGTRWERWTLAPGLIFLGALIGALPVVAEPLVVVLVVITAALHLRRDIRRTFVVLITLGAVAIFGRLGATGGPLCDPESVFQPHAVWHIGAASIVGWWVPMMRRIGSAR